MISKYRIESEFLVRDSYSGPVAGDIDSELRDISVKEMHVSRLVELLGSEGVEIDPKISFQRVNYKQKIFDCPAPAEFEVPFSFKTPNSDFVGYTLRGDGFEISVDNYVPDTLGDRSDILDGGDVKHVKGVDCRIVYEGSRDIVEVGPLFHRVCEEVFGLYNNIGFDDE